MGEKIRPALREAVSRRAAHRCEYCQTPAGFSPDPLSIEHIAPRSRGGASVMENLCLSCQGCNNCKYNATEALDWLTMRTVPLFHPRTQVWSDHFAWSAGGTEVIALTATGRATLRRLRLNRPGVVGLREALLAIGKHPPAR
jgi:hypothetical protein